MEFFIKKNSTLPVLKVQIFKDTRNNFLQFDNGLSGATITFSMYDEINNVYKITDSPASLELVPDSNPPAFFVVYQFNKTQTKKSGSYIGEFKITQSTHESILPIREKLYINVTESFVDTDFCCRPNRGERVIIRPSQTPKPSFTPTPTNTPTRTLTPTPTFTPTATFGSILIELVGEYSSGSINANYIATSNVALDVDIEVSFVNKLGTTTGSPLTISGSVIIESGNTVGISNYTISDNYSVLNDTSIFSAVSSTYTGITTNTFGIKTSSQFGVTPTPTTSLTNTPTNTPTNTATITPTPTNTQTETATSTPTPTNTQTETATPTPTPTNTQTETATPTPTPTNTQTETSTLTPTPTLTNTQTETATPTPTPTNTQTETATTTPTPTNTQTETSTPTPIPTNTQTETVTPTPTPTNTQTTTSTPTPTNTRTSTLTPTNSLTATPSLSYVERCTVSGLWTAGDPNNSGLMQFATNPLPFSAATNNMRINSVDLYGVDYSSSLSALTFGDIVKIESSVYPANYIIYELTESPSLLTPTTQWFFNNMIVKTSTVNSSPELYFFGSGATVTYYSNTFCTTPTPTPTSTSTPTPTPTATETSTPTYTATNTLTSTPTSTPQQVSSGLLLELDAYNSSSYPGTGTDVFNLQNIGTYTHTLVNSPYTVLNGIKCFDCNGTTTTIIELPQGTGPTLPTSGYTYIAWAKMKSSSDQWRTLLRTYPYDHPILVGIGTENLGFYDNNTNTFYSSGYDVTSIEDVWVQYTVVGDSSSSIYYINDTQVGTVAYGAGGNTHWAWGSINQQPFGYVANLYLYDRKLSLSEITQQYNFLAPRFVELTPTPTSSPTPTSTPTPTNTSTPTPTPTNTNTPTVTQTNTQTLTATSPIVASNLVLYYDPSNSSSYSGSGTTVNDLSGNNLGGTLSNVTYTSPAFNFNGTSSTISVADNALLEPGSGDWTMEAWVNHTVIAGSSRIIFAKTNGGLSADWGYGLRTSSAGATFGEVGNGTTSLQSNTSTLSINTWYQVVAVWTNLATNTFELFINGVSQGSKAHSFTSVKNTTNPLYIGSFNDGQFSQWLNGKVGIVRIYNSALTSSQVTQNFNADKSKYGL